VIANSHQESGGKQPQMVFYSNGNIACNYVGVVGNRVGALTMHETVARIGNWIVGVPDDDEDSFIMSKAGTGEVIALLKKNGDVYLKEKASSAGVSVCHRISDVLSQVSTIAEISAFGYSVDLGATTRASGGESTHILGWSTVLIDCGVGC
jgi:hypothetical protein